MTIDITEVYNSLRTTIKENRDVNVTPKTVISDFFLQPTALEISKLKIIISWIAGMQSFDSIIAIEANTSYLQTVAEALGTSTEEVLAIMAGVLDKLAANYNKLRKDAAFTTGIVSFYRPNAPGVEELTLSIPIGTVVSTTTGIDYAVPAAVSYSQFYYDSTYAAFMIDVAVQCRIAGTSGNTSETSVTSIQTSVPGFGNVTNKVAFTNGVDIESDADFAARLKGEISGNNIGTPNGLRNAILQNMQVTDLAVIGVGDALMQRDLGWGGKVDIYILEKELAATSWTFTYNGEAQTYLQGLRPADPTSVVTVTAGTATVIADTLTVYAGSKLSKDYLQWSVTPTIGTSVTATYFYDKRLNEVQDFIVQDTYNTGADILIKQAHIVPIDIIFNLVVFSGYSKSDIITEVKTLINALVGGLQLGDSLDQSDIVNLATVPGVDRVILPMSKFNRSSSSGSVDRITTDATEYLRISVLQIA